MKKGNTRKNLSITIGHLYGDLMNIYGDNGNIIVLKKRCEWRGIECVVKNISVHEPIKKGEINLYFFGGGQDQSQIRVSEDIRDEKKASIIKEDIERGVPLLSICGGYQLLGEYYLPHKGEKLMGLGIFPAFTQASNDRMIGNIVVKMMESEYRLLNIDNRMQNTDSTEGLLSVGDSGLPTGISLVGFENHSGKTYLKKGGIPLGQVISGFGNNGEDKTEGCVYKNAIGCYMHGSLLPKNPQLADWLIKKALEVKYGKKITLEALDDDLETLAHTQAVEMVLKAS